MTCYMRQMHWLFEALDRPYDKENRKAVDVAIRRVLELDDSLHCPEVWAAIKTLPDDDRDALPPRVAEALAAS